VRSPGLVLPQGVDLSALPQDLLEELDELEQIEAANPLARALLDPAGRGGASPKQMAFIQDQARRLFLRCGNKVGKTWIIGVWLWLAMLGEHPWRRGLKPPLQVLYVVSDLEASYADDVCSRLREVEPAGLLAANCRYDTVRGYTVRGRRGIMLRNGSHVIFRSGWQDPGALAGISPHVVAVNEPPHRKVWGEIMRAAGHHSAPILMGFTPVDYRAEPGKPPLRWLREVVEAQESKWSQTVIHLTPEDCPHRDPESIAEQLADILPWERPQRVYGEWEGVATDRVLQGYDVRPKDKGGNLACDADAPEHQVTVALAFDHGEVGGREVCLLILLWRDDESGRPHAMVLDEYVSPGRTTADTDAEHVVSMLARHGLTLGHVSKAWGDVNSAGKTSLTNVNRELERAFAILAGRPPSLPPFPILTARKGAGSIQFGWHVLNVALLQGRLSVHEQASGTSYAFRTFRGSKVGDDAELGHYVDTARYGLVEHLDVSRPAYREAMVG